MGRLVHDGFNYRWTMPEGLPKTIRAIRDAAKMLKAEIFKPVKDWSNIAEITKSGNAKCRVCLIGGPMIAAMSNGDFKKYAAIAKAYEKDEDNKPYCVLCGNRLLHTAIDAALITLDQPRDLEEPRKKSMILKIYDRAIEILKDGTANEIVEAANGALFGNGN